MARIEKSKPKETSGAYERLFGISALGTLISRVQSAVISSGTELEKLIPARVKQIDDLDKFLTLEIMQDEVMIATKKQIKKSKSLKSSGSEPDFLIFKRSKGRRVCFVVELKDGHQFDTKKSKAERLAMDTFIKRNAQNMQFRVSARFCCFNQNSRDAIVTGFKRQITQDEAMTGQEFCDLLKIDYSKIVALRKEEQPKNVNYFLQELVKIDKIRRILRKMLHDRND